MVGELLVSDLKMYPIIADFLSQNSNVRKAKCGKPNVKRTFPGGQGEKATAVFMDCLPKPIIDLLEGMLHGNHSTTFATLIHTLQSPCQQLQTSHTVQETEEVYIIVFLTVNALYYCMIYRCCF